MPTFFQNILLHLSVLTRRQFNPRLSLAMKSSWFIDRLLAVLSPPRWKTYRFRCWRSLHRQRRNRSHSCASAFLLRTPRWPRCCCSKEKPKRTDRLLRHQVALAFRLPAKTIHLASATACRRWCGKHPSWLSTFHRPFVRLRQIFWVNA